MMFAHHSKSLHIILTPNIVDIKYTSVTKTSNKSEDAEHNKVK